MNIIIVGHHKRIDWVSRLQSALPGSSAIIDMGDSGAMEGHRKALLAAQAIGKRCVIMEDDAIPVVGFTHLVEDWCERFPEHLISFYLGTGRPITWQSRVDEALSNTQDDYVVLSRLIHGVCYSVPTAAIERVLSRMSDSDDAADYAIGRAWGGRVVYPVESLVQHRDAESVERHVDKEPRTERRVARRLAGPLMYER